MTDVASTVGAVGRRRADALRNDEVVLRAAEELVAADPSAVTMAAIAARAGVGKGTLYRAFGDRGGLLRALMSDRASAVLDDLATGADAGHLDATSWLEHVMDTLARFKLEHRGLNTAIEADQHVGPYEAARYDEWHALVAGALAAVRGVSAGAVAFDAHALLAAIRSDLVEHLLGRVGLGEQEYLDDLRSLVHAVARG